ncbi:MAG: 16S rRNA (uracil(1498)-N(3))-methyltransferase [Bacteroidia bacterium]|nr:16S rRNA (uracil(1498)-N(3))-methyltransferase [Bacteroidia bacterium]
MELPFFYIAGFDSTQKEIILDEDTSKHIIQVLRMKIGSQINLTDGKGNLLTSEIIDDNKNHCTIKVIDSRFTTHDSRKITIAISLLKNTNRFEWFLEKVTEIGISEIIPLICDRTEKEKFRKERMQGIIISAMLQSQQCWLPILNEPISYELLFHKQEVVNTSQKFIAHCLKEQKRNLSDLVNESLPSQLILIGPEGDFTPGEIEMALQNHFIPVALGDTRLRAETAGVAAATLLRLV